jgi:hypothetical protein
MNKFQEILKAWRTKWNPTPAQAQHAERRLEICAGCDSRQELFKDSNFWVVCGECSCPLEAKSHSPKKGACDLGKWDVIDNQSKLF